MVAIWAVIPAMALMFVAGIKFALRRHIHFVNNTNLDRLDIQVSPDRRVFIISNKDNDGQDL